MENFEEKKEGTGIGEEEGGIVERHNGARLPVDVVLLLEEADEGVSDALRGPFDSLRFEP